MSCQIHRITLSCSSHARPYNQNPFRSVRTIRRGIPRHRPCRLSSVISQALPWRCWQWLKITRIARILWDVKWSSGWHPWDHRDDQWLLAGCGVARFCLPGLAQPFQRATEQMAAWHVPETPRDTCGWSYVGRRVAYRFCSMGKKKRRSEIRRQRVTITYRYTNDDLLNLLSSLLHPYITCF
jgi:hypothetical protein